MNSFENILLRFKAEVGAKSDKAAAELLGLTPTALNERKRRQAFPGNKLLELKASRPDLKFDPMYVLTGRREGAMETIARDLQEAAHEVRLLKDSFQIGEIKAQEYGADSKRSAAVSRKFDLLNEQAKLAVESMIDALLKTNGE